MKDTFTIATSGLIFDEQGRILLCHRRDYDLWNLPGGAMEIGESPWDSVVREVKEETGFDVETIRLAGIYNKPEKKEICFAFVCKIIGGLLTLNDEADKIEYFNVKALPKNISPKQVERIKDTLEEKNIVYKDQRGKSSIDLVKRGWSVPGNYLLSAVKESKAERKSGNFHSFKNNQEARDFLDNK